jgi:hypothetical protein
MSKDSALRPCSLNRMLLHPLKERCFVAQSRSAIATAHGSAVNVGHTARTLCWQYERLPRRYRSFEANCFVSRLPSEHECGVDGSHDPRTPALSAAESPKSGAVLGSMSVEQHNVLAARERRNPDCRVPGFRSTAWSRDGDEVISLTSYSWQCRREGRPISRTARSLASAKDPIASCLSSTWPRRQHSRKLSCHVHEPVWAVELRDVQLRFVPRIRVG